MTETVWRLFDDFAAGWARGERPDAREYLVRAGDDAPRLLELIDEHLQWAPPPDPDPDLIALLSAWRLGEPPLLELRRRRGRSRSAIVDALIAALGIDTAKRGRVRDNYHRLETGQLRLARVDARVLRIVATALGVRVTDLAAWPGAHPLEGALMMRDAIAADALHEAWPSPAEPDDVDRLFGIG